ncbi:MAG: immunoglobulin-like domain-containing protein [Bacteroidia bacterium]
MKKSFTFQSWLLTFLLLLGSSGIVNAQMSGTYTIDPNGSGSSNYTTFDDAVDDLESFGVSGPVIFQASADSFNEMITITKITGASATNTITFEGAGMYSTVLWYSTATTTVYLTDTAGYITFRDMTIDDPNTVGTAIHIDRASHHIKVENCYLTTFMGTGGNILVYFNNGAHNNTFTNNVMKGGYYSVYANYSSGGDSNSFIGNDISEYYSYGFYYWYQRNYELKDNILHSPGYQYAYAFAPYYCQNFLLEGNTAIGNYAGILMQYADNYQIIENRLLDCGVYGLYIFNGNATSTDTSYVTNNMISSTQPGYVIYNYQVNRTFYYHNSLYGSNPYYGLMFQQGGSNHFVNNSAEITAQYYGIYVNGTPFSRMEYNNLYISGTNGYAYWNALYGSLAALQAGTGLNQNTISVDPEYVSITDLHADGQLLNNEGIELSAVPFDIDGDPRPYSPDTLVDIGADEIYVGDYDLDVETLDNPKSLVLNGNNVVEATFRNKGKMALSSTDVKVAYSYDGGTNWTEDTLVITSLVPGARQSFTFTRPFTISTSATYTVCVRITQQISGDPDNSDQKCIDVCDGVSGTIVVDATGNGDHTTINGALDELKCGLIGPVTIQIRPGTYTETIKIDPIFGLSSTNTVTIEGAGKDSVFIEQSGGAAAVTLDGVSYITIQDVSIEASTNSTGVKITGGSANNTIKDNIIDVGSSTSTTSVGIVIGNSYNSGTTDNTYNLIQNNEVYGGYMGITCAGASNASNGRVKGNRFIGNIVDDHYFYGMYLWYNQDIEVIGNKLLGATIATSGYGMYAFYNNNSKYNGNTISGYNYSPWMWYYENYINSTSTDTTWAVNNMLGGNMTNTYGYTLYAIYATKVKFYHNSLLHLPGSYHAFMIQYGSWDMRNNNFSHASASAANYYTFYFYNPTWIALDYNNYESLSSTAIYYNGATYQGLADWQTGQPQYNQNSTAEDANYNSTSDLHLAFGKPFPTGASLGITEDIDGDPRCLMAPTMGADESRYPVPPPVAGFLAPDTAWLNSGTDFYNSASKSDNYFYNWYLDGSHQSSSLHFKHTFSSAGTYDIKLVTEGCSGIDSITKTVIVSAPTRAPEADFIADKTEGVVFESIQLTDLSENGPSSWEWIVSPDSIYDPNFGFSLATYHFSSGSEFSQNPSIVFEYPGKYSICLVATNALGSDTVCFTDYIVILNTVNMCMFPFDTDDQEGILYDDGGPLGNYSAGKNGFNMCYYTINSCGGDVELAINEFQLNTGDYLRVYDGTSSNGTPLWDEINFSKGMNGNITDGSVRTILTASSGRMYIEFETDASTFTTGAGFKATWRTIPRQFAQPQANFLSADTICVDIPVEFRSNSTGDDLTYRWDVLADSAFENSTMNQEYTFRSVGTYPVRLHISNCAGIDTVTKWVVVENASKTPNPDFDVSNTKPAIGALVQLTDLTDYCVTDYKWKISPSTYFFVNSTTNTSRHPELTFNAPGFYDVELVVTNPLGADSILKQQVIQVISYCKPAVISLNNELGISRVSLTTLNHNVLLDNISNIGEEEYTNYTATHSATLAMGSDYLISLERIFATSAMNRAVWIDFNRDGDFDDAGELVASEASAFTLSWTDTFSIPLTAEEGSTRLRIGTNRGSNNNLPCGPNLFGEYEDYELILLPDDEPPVITLIGNDTTYLQQCFQYSEQGATALDNVDGDISNQIVITNNVDSSSVGTHEVWYDVTDQSGNVATRVVRKVIVEMDTIAPALSLIGNDPDTIEVHTSYMEPGYIATDTCDGNITSQVSIVSSLDTAIVGSYVLTYSVTDANNNTSVETRTVVVADRTLPQISINGSDTVVIDVHTSYTEEWVTYSDNYDNSLNVQVIGMVDTAMVGTYVLNYCVTDGEGNGPVCDTRVVIVQDTVAPTATLLEGDTIDWEVNVAFVDPGYNLSDNSSAHVDVNITNNVDVSMLGSYLITYTFEDGSGNVIQKIRVVNVVDIRAPIISLNLPLVDTVYRWAEYSDPDFTLNDNYYDSADIQIHYGGSFTHTLLEGSFTRTYQAEDPSGNKSAVLQRVIVVVRDTTTGVADHDANKPQIMVYPNPANGNFSVEVNTPEANSRTRVSITDMTGAEVMVLDERMSTSNVIYPVNMSSAAAGVYFVRVTSDAHVVIKKVVLVK